MNHSCVAHATNSNGLLKDLKVKPIQHERQCGESLRYLT